jgi:hypothetical protein
MSAYDDLIEKINASSATPGQKKNAIAAAKQANKTGKGVSKNETTYILNNITTVTPQNLGTAASRIAANAAFVPAKVNDTKKGKTLKGPTPEEIAADKAKKATAAATAKEFKDAKNFGFIFKGLTGIDPVKNPWVNSLYTVGKKFVDGGQISWNDPNIYNLILNDTASPELQGFRDRFSAYLDVRNKRASSGQTVGEGFRNIAEYVALEGEYQTALQSRPAFKSLATQENIKKFITGTTSVQEVQDRIDNAYFAITTADDALKEQIRQQFPTLTDDDLALTLVTGNTDAVEQKIKFGAAAIAASAKLAGITSASNLEDLAKQGVDRETALKGFQQVARERTGIQQASRMFGGKAPTQKELESEALGTGAESASARRLRSQARAQFAGQSGITTGSLGRKKQI